MAAVDRPALGMKCTRVSGVEAAGGATGTLIVIDVLRAFTTAACAFDRGAVCIELVSTPEEALARRAEDPARLLVGEHMGRKLEGFDFGNSPVELHAAELRGRELVMRSTAGTQGVVRGIHARHILLGSLVVASATAALARRLGEPVTILASGSPSGPGEEDEACAELLEALIEGREPDRARCLSRVLSSRAAAKALDPRVDWITPADLGAALALDRFDFAMQVERVGGRWLAGKAVPPQK
jgi:2-phosphosulfolactate phosphatase